MRATTLAARAAVPGPGDCTVAPLDLRGDRFVALPKQSAVLCDRESAVMVYVGGVASGKTETGAKWVIRRAAECPGGTLLIGAPTYPMLHDATWPMLVASVPREVVRRSVQFEMDIMCGPKPLHVIGRNLSKPAALQGINADAGAWLDEASVFTRAAFEEVQRRTRAVRRPWRPQTVITSNSAGHNWLWELAVEKPPPGLSLVHTTTYENTYLPPDYIRQLESTLPPRSIRRWLGGSFEDFSGDVYDGFNVERDVIDAPSTWRAGGFPPRDWLRLGGVDFGWDSAFVYLDVAKSPGAQPCYYVFGEHYRTAAHLDVHAAAIGALWAADRGSTRTIWSEHEKQGRKELERLLGATLRPANKGLDSIDALQVRIDLINRLFAAGQLKIIRGRAPNLVRELREREYHETGPHKGRPKDENNHATDALEYAVYSDWQRGGVRFTRATYLG